MSFVTPPLCPVYILPRYVVMHCSPPYPHSQGLPTAHLHLVQGELREWGGHGTCYRPSLWPTLHCLRRNAHHQRPKAGKYILLWSSSSSSLSFLILGLCNRGCVVDLYLFRVVGQGKISPSKFFFLVFLSSSFHPSLFLGCVIIAAIPYRYIYLQLLSKIKFHFLHSFNSFSFPHFFVSLLSSPCLGCVIEAV